MSFDAEALAEVAGVPAGWFDADRLKTSPDEALKALGDGFGLFELPTQ